MLCELVLSSSSTFHSSSSSIFFLLLFLSSSLYNILPPLSILFLILYILFSFVLYHIFNLKKKYQSKRERKGGRWCGRSTERKRRWMKKIHEITNDTHTEEAKMVFFFLSALRLNPTICTQHTHPAFITHMQDICQTFTIIHIWMYKH